MFELDSMFETQIMNALKQLGLVNEENKGYQLYTIRHKQAFMAIEYVLTGNITPAGASHDTDKLLLYGILSKKDSSNIHRKYSTHHIENARNDQDRLYSIIDYECARFTKSDKPLNAFDTVYKYHPDYIEVLNPILIKYGLDSSTNRDFDFSKWSQEKDKIIQFALKRTLHDISILYSNIVNFGVNKAIEIFYKNQ